MVFDYQSYINLFELLKENNYEFSDYHNWESKEKCVILRHDIDNDITKAEELAEIEFDYHVASTYFVLISSDFYNTFSHKNVSSLRRIKQLGHQIGLHFDEMNYPEIAGNKEDVKQAIIMEAHVLQDAIGIPIESFSYHRPSKCILQENLEIPGMVNSYSDRFFHGFKYLSDSRRSWREPVEEIIRSNRYDRLHILTHAFWYNTKEISMAETLIRFIQSAENERKKTLSENLTNYEEALGGC